MKTSNFYSTSSPRPLRHCRDATQELNVLTNVKICADAVVHQRLQIFWQLQYAQCTNYRPSRRPIWYLISEAVIHSWRHSL